MLPKKLLDKLIFWDIETTSQYPTYKDMPEKFQAIFKRRFKKDFADIEADKKKQEELGVQQEIVDGWHDEAVEHFYSQKAPTQAEYLKIICISCGILILPEKPEDPYKIKAVSYYGDDEKELLEKFLKGMSKPVNDIVNYSWIAHNGAVFDVPVLLKRIVINGLSIPKFLDIAELKPWQRDFHVDTKVCWSLGVYDNHVSLDHLAAMFDVPSSKEDMEGGMVKDVYWIEKDLPRIEKYCRQDIYALAEVYMRIKGIKNELVIQ